MSELTEYLLDEIPGLLQIPCCPCCGEKCVLGDGWNVIVTDYGIRWMCKGCYAYGARNARGRRWWASQTVGKGCSSYLGDDGDRLTHHHNDWHPEISEEEAEEMGIPVCQN